MTPGAAAEDGRDLVVLLRGVNIGGRKVTSADLTGALAGIAGVTAVRTVLATGNAVVRTTLPPDALREAAEAALQTVTGHAIAVIVLSREDVHMAADANPYPLDDATTHAYVTLARDPAALDVWQRVAGEVGQECTRVAPFALLWPCPVGSSLDVPFAKAQGRKPLTDHADDVTTRNARTLQKLLAVRW